MSDEEFFRPPSAGMWMTFVLCWTVIAVGFMGDWGIWLLLPVGLVCLTVSGSVVMRWAGRWIGFIVSHTVREMVLGFHEGWTESRAKRRAEKS